jgi:hypothetical protein
LLHEIKTRTPSSPRLCHDRFRHVRLATTFGIVSTTSVSVGCAAFQVWPCGSPEVPLPVNVMVSWSFAACSRVVGGAGAGGRHRCRRGYRGGYRQGRARAPLTVKVHSLPLLGLRGSQRCRNRCLRRCAGC